jgi:hypothetical protein
VAVADYFPDRSRAAGERFKVEPSRRFAGLSGFMRLLDGKLDAVFIESPPFFYPEQAAAAVEAGRHVFVAKPLAVDVPGCLSVIESGRRATEKQLSFLVDFQTRDPDSKKWGRKSQYEAYFILRWLAGIGGEKTGGGWFDPYGTSPATYVEQARQTVLAGAKEMLLFCHASLVEPQHSACTEALIPEIDALRELARRICGRTPLGVAAPKPPSSQPAKGEEYLFDHAGMLGIPLVPSTSLAADAPAALITSHAARDPATVSWLESSPKRPVLVTRIAEGLLPAGALLEHPVSRLAWMDDARELLDLPREALDAARDRLLEPLGVRFSAPGRVALYLFGTAGSGEARGADRLAAIESFREDTAEVMLEVAGWRARDEETIVLPPARRSEVRRERRGAGEAWVLPPRTLAAFWLEGIHPGRVPGAALEGKLLSPRLDRAGQDPLDRLRIRDPVDREPPLRAIPSRAHAEHARLPRSKPALRHREVEQSSRVYAARPGREVGEARRAVAALPARQLAGDVELDDLVLAEKEREARRPGLALPAQASQEDEDVRLGALIELIEAHVRSLPADRVTDLELAHVRAQARRPRVVEPLVLATIVVDQTGEAALGLPRQLDELLERLPLASRDPRADPSRRVRGEEVPVRRIAQEGWRLAFPWWRVAGADHVLHALDDDLLDGRVEPRGPRVVDHREVGLVAAFLEYPARRDVARHIVAPAVEPDPPPVELALQPNGVVDDDLAGEENDGELLAERPRDHRVVDVLGELAVAIELLEHQLRAVAVEAALL